MDITLIVLIAIIALALLILLGRRVFIKSQFLSHRPGQGKTPADEGLDFKEYWIARNGHRLQSWLVRAPKNGDTEIALLLFQGGNDVISELTHVQKYLYDHGITSMIFDYGGNGDSLGKISYENINADNVAVFQKFRELLGNDAQLYLWGFSAGTGRLMDVLPKVQDEIEGAVLMGPFSSIKRILPPGSSIEKDSLVHKLLGLLLMPPFWNNKARIQEVDTPILIVHSRDDELASFWHAEELVSAGKNVQLIPLDGLKHNDCWKPLHKEYWYPVFDFIGTGK